MGYSKDLVISAVSGSSVTMKHNRSELAADVGIVWDSFGLTAKGGFKPVSVPGVTGICTKNYKNDAIFWTVVGRCCGGAMLPSVTLTSRYTSLGAERNKIIGLLAGTYNITDGPFVLPSDDGGSVVVEHLIFKQLSGNGAMHEFELTLSHLLGRMA